MARSGQKYLLKGENKSDGRKNSPKFFLFQRNDLSLQSENEPLHIVVTKQANNNNKKNILK